MRCSIFHRKHVEVQRDAPHHGTAEARDVPVHGVQLDDLLHVEAADGKSHLGGVVEDGGEIQQRRDEHAPDVHDVPAVKVSCGIAAMTASSWSTASGVIISDSRKWLIYFCSVSCRTVRN